MEAGLQVTSVPGAVRGARGADQRAGCRPTPSCLPAFCRRKGGQRRKRLEELKPVPATLIFYETALALHAALADMAEISARARGGDRQGSSPSCMRAWRAATPAELAAAFDSTELKGSSWCWSVRQIRDEASIGDDAIVASLETGAEAGKLPRRRAQRRRQIQLKRRRVYELGLTLERKGSDRP